MNLSESRGTSNHPHLTSPVKGEAFRPLPVRQFHHHGDTENTEPHGGLRWAMSDNGTVNSAMPDEATSSILAELDAAHALASAAYAQRDVDACRRVFAEDLQYTQLNGETIGVDRLMSDVMDQFSRVKACGSTYERESIEIEGSELATEMLTQSAWAEIPAFGLFRRRWQIRRRGRYTWRKTADGWKLAKVVVLAETVT